jgi:hypothetical protein
MGERFINRVSTEEIVMAYEPKDGSGVLFKNDKEGNESRPDYKGNILINGVEYELASWIKDGKKGKFMSLSAKVRERKDVSGQQAAPAQHRPAQQAPAPAWDGFDDSSIPF